MGIEVTGCPGHYGLTNSMGMPTRALSHASRTLQESIAWLLTREFATVRLGAPGVMVELHLDRFD